MEAYEGDYAESTATSATGIPINHSHIIPPNNGAAQPLTQPDARPSRGSVTSDSTGRPLRVRVFNPDPPEPPRVDHTPPTLLTHPSSPLLQHAGRPSSPMLMPPAQPPSPRPPLLLHGHSRSQSGIYDIFIPDVHSECSDDHRDEYENFIDDVLKPLLKEKRITSLCFREDAPATGTLLEKIQSCQKQCLRTVIVVCQGMLSTTHLHMLGDKGLLHLQINSSLKNIPGMIHQDAIRFITDRDRTNAMRRIEKDLKQNAIALPAAEDHDTAPVLRDNIDGNKAIARGAQSEFIPPRQNPTTHVRPTWHVGTGATFGIPGGPGHAAEDESQSGDPSLSLEDPDKTVRMKSLDELDDIRTPQSCDTVSLLQHPTYAKLDYDLSLKSVLRGDCGRGQRHSFHAIENPRTNSCVYVNYSLEEHHTTTTDREANTMLEKLAKGAHKDSLKKQKASFLLHQVISLALSKETRQYAALSYLASDSQYPVVVQHALQCLWQLIVLRPHKIDQHFIDHIVIMEKVLRPRPNEKVSGRWTVNEEVASAFLEVYHLLMSLIYIGSMDGITINIKDTEYIESQDGFAVIHKRIKESFSSLETKFQYHKALITDYINSLLQTARGVPKRTSKRNDARGTIMKHIHKLLEEKLDQNSRIATSKVLMQTFGNLAPHDQAAVYLYLCLLTRVAETKNGFKEAGDKVLSQMINVLMKSSIMAAGYGLVLRCYGCDVSSTKEENSDNMIDCLAPDGQLMSKCKRLVGEREGKSILMDLAKCVRKLFFHRDLRLRKLLLESLILMDSKDTKTIKLSFQDILQTGAIEKVENMLRWYGLELDAGPYVRFKEAFSTLWPRDGTSVAYYEGSFGSTTSKVLCKIQKIARVSQLICSEDSKYTQHNILAEIKALQYAHQRKEPCDYILDLLAFNDNAEIGPLFYIFSCNNAKNLSSHLKTMLEKPNREDLHKLVNYCLGVLLAMIFCKDNRILVRSATAASFLLEDVPKFALPGDCELDSTEYQGMKDDRIAVEFSAPEALLECKHTHMSMAYLTAMILFEILSLGVHPFEEIDMPRGAKVLQILKYRLKPERRRTIPERLYMGLCTCLMSTPSERATLEDLLQLLRDFRNNNKPVTTLTSPNKERDTKWKEDCAYLKKVSWKQPPIPHMTLPSELNNIHRFSDLWRNAVEDSDYIQYCSGDEQTRCGSKDVREIDDPEKDEKNRQEGQWICPLKLKKPDPRTITKLQELDHPNVATVEQVQCKENKMCINTYSDVTVFQFLTGRKISEPERQNIYLQMAKGVDYLHNQGLLHCHLTPNAFFIHPGSHEVRLGNLGRCTLLEKGEFDEELHHAMCRPFEEIPKSSWRWLPMETLTSNCYRTSTDIYSLGLCIWTLEKANSSEGEPLHKIAPFCYKETDDLPTVQLCRHVLPRAHNCPERWNKVVQACTTYPACCRPVMSEITAFFSDSENSEIILTDPVEEIEKHDDQNTRKLHEEHTEVTRRRISRMLLQDAREQIKYHSVDIGEYARAIYSGREEIQPAEYEPLEDTQCGQYTIRKKKKSNPLKKIRKSLFNALGKGKKKDKAYRPAIGLPSVAELEMSGAYARASIHSESGLYENTKGSNPYLRMADRAENTPLKSLSFPDLSTDECPYEELDAPYLNPVLPERKNLPPLERDDEEYHVHTFAVANKPFPIAQESENYQYTDMSAMPPILPISTESAIDTPAKPVYENLEKPRDG